MRGVKRRAWYVLGLLLGLIILVAWQLPSNKLKIVACDVGQGDAILLVKGQNQVLIDGGPSGEKIVSCLTRYMPFWDREIELIVLTHSDYDHMNGLTSVVERYQVKQFVTADGVHFSSSLMRLRDKLSEYRVKVVGVEQGDVVRVKTKRGRDKIELDVLWPPEIERQYLAVYRSGKSELDDKQILGVSAKRGEINDRSVVLVLKEGDYRALFTGDAGVQAEKEMIKGGWLGKVDYLKVGHHGSKSSTSLELLQTIQPKVAVISVGKKNRYGHPSQQVLERLKSLGIRTLRTDEMGDVVLSSEVDE